MLTGKILITGGSGSLGTAILNRAKEENWDALFTVVSRNETRMNVVRSTYPEVRCEIGDVRDLQWLKTIFPGHDTVIHAAALKVVPTAETNVRETILTNVIGSMNVAYAAIESSIKKVVGISTDKACAPVTIYGATKFLGVEGLFREAANWGDTSFSCVRYGNVLRSNASVVPLFERLIKEDRPLTITDKRMTRFWLSMNDAIDLIIYGYGIPSGLVAVPKAGAMSMIDLAKVLDPNREIVEIGIRPGEKLHEVMVHGGESMHTVETKNVFLISPPYMNPSNSMPHGFEYSSDTAHKIPLEVMHNMLNSYNPYGGPVYG